MLVLALKSFRAIRSKAAREDLIEHLERIRSAAQREPGQSVLFRATGYLLIELHDRYGALEAFRRACHATAWDAAAALAMAELLRDDHNHEESLRYSSELVEKGYGNPEACSLESAIRVIKARWVVAIWLNRYDEAKEASRNWRSAGSLRPTLGCIFFTAIKRSLEREPDTKKVERGIKECADCIDTLYEADGHLPFLAHAAFNALDEMVRLTRLHKLTPATNHAIVTFVDKHLHAMCLSDRDRPIEDWRVREAIGMLRAVDCGSARNPLLSSRWDEAAQDDGAGGALGSYGYVKIKIYHRPKQPQCNYLFGEDAEGQQYYISRRATGLTQRQFDELRVGDVMSVWPEESQTAGKAISVRDAVPW